MAWPAGPAEDRRDPRHFDPGVVRLTPGIDLLHAGRKQQIDPEPPQRLLVGPQGAGVAFEVLPGGELQGVDEDRNHQAIAALPRLAHQLQMAIMQVAHGRHQPDILTGLAPLAQLPAQPGQVRFELNLSVHE